MKIESGMISNKSIFIIGLFILLSPCCVARPLVSNAYYIYVKPNDTLFKKAVFKNGVRINYKCKCYAGGFDLEFTGADADTIDTYIKMNLPTNKYSMVEFSKIANKFRGDFKNLDLWNSKIYLIENNKKGGYFYYRVHFYTIEGRE